MADTRILHVSDTHLGYRQYRSDKRRADFLSNFEQAVKKAIEHDVDAVVHTGDLFHDSDPSVPDLYGCGKLFKRLEEQSIPTHGIVGNHERKTDTELLDLASRMGDVRRLSREPTLVGDIALYGVDAVPSRSWDNTSFELEEPPDAANITILCLHQLFAPPLEAEHAHHDLSDVLDAVGIELDGVALGDAHTPASDVVDGTEVWYAGSTARTQKSQDPARTVQLIETDNGEIKRTQIGLDTRQFEVVTIEFGPDDGAEHLYNRLGQQSLNDAVVALELTGERGPVAASDAVTAAREEGAAVVSVDDGRGKVELNTDGIDVQDVEDHAAVVTDHVEDEEFAPIVETTDERIRTEESVPVGTGGAAQEIRAELEEAMETAFDDTEVKTNDGEAATEEDQ